MSNVDRNLSGAYSEALFQTAKKADALDAIAGQVGELGQLVRSEPKLRAFIEAPNIPRDTKEQLVVRVFGGKYNTVLINFVRMLIRRGRLGIFFESLSGYQERYRAHLGIASATLTSAVELSETEKQHLEASLMRITKKKLEIDWRVDPAKIGGIRFQSGDTLIDTTIARKLEKLRHDLLETRVV